MPDEQVPRGRNGKLLPAAAEPQHGVRGDTGRSRGRKGEERMVPCDGKPQEKREPSRPLPVPPSIPVQGRDPLRTTPHLPAAETHPALGAGATACTSELVVKQALHASSGLATGRMSGTSASGCTVIVRMGDADGADRRQRRARKSRAKEKTKGRVDQQVGSLPCRARARLRQRPRCQRTPCRVKARRSWRGKSSCCRAESRRSASLQKESRRGRNGEKYYWATRSDIWATNFLVTEYVWQN